MKTYITKKNDINRKWYCIDADGVVLGRLTTQIAIKLQGKDKVKYSPSIDIGDNIIVVNAAKVKVTGNKFNDKIYYRHSGYIGNLKKTSFAEMVKKKPEDIIRFAVKGMLPKGHLGKQMIKKLHIYAGAEHKNQAQNPEILQLKV